MPGAINLKQLNHYNIRVPAALLEKARAFYTQVIGLKEGWAPGPMAFPVHWLYLGDQPVLHLNGQPAGEQPTGTEARPTGWLDHIAFSCSDHKACRTRLDELGVPYVRNEFPGFGIVQFLLRDPVGIQIELNFAGEAI